MMGLLLSSITSMPTFHTDSSALLQTQASGRDLAARCTSLTVGIQSAA